MNEHQPNIVEPCRGAHCGRLLGYRFESEQAARDWLKSVAKLPFEPDPRSGFWVSVALSYAGLELCASRLDLACFPDAFVSGMAQRAARLCDPTWPSDPALSARAPTHALLLVLADIDAGEDGGRELRSVLLDCGRAAQAGEGVGSHGARLVAALKPRLDAVCDHLPAGRIWSEDLHHPLCPSDKAEAGPRHPVVEYFGFRDGIGQPKFRVTDEPSAVFIDSDNPLLDQGTYLVVRQLQQQPRQFWQQLRTVPGKDPRQLAELLVGRRQDGSSLDGSGGPRSADGESNTPAFRQVPGETAPRCPFQSHARRVNPQVDGGARADNNPRLLRRAMSYYDGNNEVGMMFMAYNADIEAQFEFIQANWIARGNAAGGLSGHRDPIAALAPEGETVPAAPTFVAAGAAGQAPTSLALASCVKLQWGEYFFVPSRAGLKRLCDERSHEPLRSSGDAAALEQALACINDASRAPEFWQTRVPEQGLKLCDHVFVKRVCDLQQVLRDEHPSRGFSVSEYGKRGRSMLGPIMLTLDSDSPAYAVAAHARALLPSTDEDLIGLRELAAFASREFLQAMFDAAGIRDLAQPPDGASFYSGALIAFVVAELWAAWGLPSPSSGAYAVWAQQISEPIARLGLDAIRVAQGQQAGNDLRRHLLQLVSEAREARASEHTPLSASLAYFEQVDASDGETVNALAGLIVGSAATLAGTFMEGLAAYARLRQSADITGLPPLTGEAPAQHPKRSLYEAVIERSLASVFGGSPDYLYRTYQGPATQRFAGGPSLEPSDKVVVWLGGAAASQPSLRFGAGPHHCPGMPVAKAVLEGTLHSLQSLTRLERADATGLHFAYRL